MTDGSQTADRLNAPEFLRGNIILPLILLVFCAVIVLAGFRVYQAQKKEVESAAAAQLSAIDLKVQQVRAWRSERLGAARFLASNPMLVAPVNPEETAELQEWLQRFRDQVWLLGRSRGRPDGARPGWRPGPAGGPASAGPCCGGPSVGTSRGFGFGSILRPIRQDGHRCSRCVKPPGPLETGHSPDSIAVGRCCQSRGRDQFFERIRIPSPLELYEVILHRPPVPALPASEMRGNLPYRTTLGERREDDSHNAACRFFAVSCVSSAGFGAGIALFHRPLSLRRPVERF